MAGLVDMANSPAEVKQELASPAPVSSGQVPAYPYGLCIRLEQEQIDKLGLDSAVDVGDVLHVQCLMKVTAVSTRETTDGAATKSYKCVELQITNMGVSDLHEEAEPAPQKKFGRAIKYNAE